MNVSRETLKRTTDRRFMSRTVRYPLDVGVKEKDMDI